jgi:phytanoyl-CoA hydroxylase
VQTKTNKYFLDSGDKIRFFFEENAFTDKGELKQAKKLSINKIAHGKYLQLLLLSSFLASSCNTSIHCV